MAQSVELTFDRATDTALTRGWDLLADAGLPSSRRAQPSPDHRPHITLYAGDAISPEAEAALPDLVAGLELTVRVGVLMLFGPRRGSYVLVRQVIASGDLLTLQSRVAGTCGADHLGQFGPGSWTPHVTLAPRLPTARVGDAVTALGPCDEVVARVTSCRRWDGERRTAWWLSR